MHQPVAGRFQINDPQNYRFYNGIKPFFFQSEGSPWHNGKVPPGCVAFSVYPCICRFHAGFPADGSYFIVAALLAFATGTSWGTFSILIAA